MEIKNGIYLVDGIRGANSYLYVSEDSISVIDTGMPGNAERILKQIKALNKFTGGFGISEKDVRSGI